MDLPKQSSVSRKKKWRAGSESFQKSRTVTGELSSQDPIMEFSSKMVKVTNLLPAEKKGHLKFKTSVLKTFEKYSSRINNEGLGFESESLDEKKREHIWKKRNKVNVKSNVLGMMKKKPKLKSKEKKFQNIGITETTLKFVENTKDFDKIKLKMKRHNDYNYSVSMRSTYNKNTTKEIRKRNSKILNKFSQNLLNISWKNKGAIKKTS